MPGASANPFTKCFLCICATASSRRHWPVVLRYARPKYPDHGDGEEGEKCLEEAAVDASAGRVAEMYANDVLEDLTDGEEEGRADQVNYIS